VNRNITTLIWAGDTDFICNWLGNLYTANEIKYAGQGDFVQSNLQPYTVHGQKKGEYKTVKNLSFLRVYNAGHSVMAYEPELSLQVFKQIIDKQTLTPT
jgi:carboxypeptidase C (cathepsin A)